MFCSALFLCGTAIYACVLADTVLRPWSWISSWLVIQMPHSLPWKLIGRPGIAHLWCCQWSFDAWSTATFHCSASWCKDLNSLILVSFGKLPYDWGLSHGCPCCLHKIKMAGHWIAGSGHESIIKDGEAVGEAMIWGQLLDCLHHSIKSCKITGVVWPLAGWQGIPVWWVFLC